MDKLIRNIIQTPDGTVLESLHRWDYKEHLDANGELYILDGGKDYVRMSVNKEPAVWLGAYFSDKHELVREKFEWTSFGKNGDEPATRNLLKDLTTEHISAIIEWGKDSSTQLTELEIRMFKNELDYRTR